MDRIINQLGSIAGTLSIKLIPKPINYIIFKHLSRWGGVCTSFFVCFFLSTVSGIVKIFTLALIQWKKRIYGTSRDFDTKTWNHLAVERS